MVTDALERVSEWLTLEEVATALGTSVGKVNRMLEEYTLFAVKRDKKMMVPKELILEGEPLASLRGTLILLHDSGYSTEEAIQWLYTDSEVLGEAPIQSLIAGKKAPVRRLAQMIDL